MGKLEFQSGSAVCIRATEYNATDPDPSRWKQPSASRTRSRNLITNDSTSQFDVTFDRPVQTSSFTAEPGGVDQGSGRLDPGPANLRFDLDRSADHAATTAGPGTLDSTLTVSSDDTLQIADITVTLTSRLRGFRPHSGPGGTERRYNPAIFGRGRRWPRLCQHRLRRLGTKLHHPGTAPFTGTFMPEYKCQLNHAHRSTGLIADGIWHLSSPTPRPALPPRWNRGR